jgi:hypothetical protein
VTSRSLLALAGVLLLPTALRAQTMRTTSVSRQQHGEKEFSAKIDFAAGTVTVRPATTGTLYSMRLRYDTERYTPLSHFNSDTRQVVLGTQSVGDGGLRVSNREHLAQNAVIELSPTADLALDANFGAVEAGLELGGLRITEARIRTAASKSTLRFSSPNQAVCRSLELNAGAAEFQALKLGNSGCREIGFEGGVGDVTLDLTGAWPVDAHVSARVSMAGLTIRLPRSVGVKLKVSRFLASFNPAGFTRQGEQYVSDGYESRTRHLSIDITSTVGDINIVWIN